MSKPVKELVRKEMLQRFGSVDSLAIIGFTGLKAVANNELRGRLSEKGMHVTVVKNALAKQAFKQMGIEPASVLLEGPCALVYGGESAVTMVRELLAIGKDMPALTVKGALMEGTVFGLDQVEALSKFPTRDEALAKLVGSILGAGGKVAACLVAPGRKVASILKTIEDKAKEAAPAGEAPAAA